MAADPYGYDDTDTVDQSRRKAQMDALNGLATDPLSDALHSASGGWQSIAPMSLPSPPSQAPTPTSANNSGGGAQQQAVRPAFQPPAPMAMGGGAQVSIGDATSAKAPAMTDEVTALLRQRLQSLSQPMDVASDPIFQGQQKAFNVQSQRDADRTRASEAQRRAVSGTGGLDTAIRGIGEQQGQRNQAYTANLTAERYQQREAQLNQAISMARAVGQDDIATQLENEKLKLATEALRVQQSLGQQDIDLRGFLGSGQLGLGQQQVDLGYGNLGLGYAGLQNSMNRDSILALLGGS